MRKMSRLLPMLVGLKLEKLTLVPPKLATRRNTPMNSVLDFHGGDGCMWVLHRALVAAVNYPLPSRQEPWCHAMELVLRAPDILQSLPRVPIHFPGIWGSQRYVSNLQHVGVPMQSGVPFFCNTESFKRRNHSRLPHHPLHPAA